MKMKKPCEENKTVLLKKELLYTVMCRKLEYFGHIICGLKYRLLQTIMEGKVEGKWWFGRKRLSWLWNTRSWMGLGLEKLFVQPVYPR